MLNEFEIFNYKLDTTNIKDLDKLKEVLLEKKIVHNKYKNKIKKMDERELKNFVYTGVYTEVIWEGVGIIFIEMQNKNLKEIVKHIVSVELEAINILRILVYNIDNIDRYSGNFFMYLLHFKNNYEKQFKALLFELSKKPYIDKLDLIYLFKNLLVK